MVLGTVQVGCLFWQPVSFASGIRARASGSEAQSSKHRTQGSDVIFRVPWFKPMTLETILAWDLGLRVANPKPGEP